MDKFSRIIQNPRYRFHPKTYGNLTNRIVTAVITALYHRTLDSLQHFRSTLNPLCLKSAFSSRKVAKFLIDLPKKNQRFN